MRGRNTSGFRCKCRAVQFLRKLITIFLLFLMHFNDVFGQYFEWFVCTLRRDSVIRLVALIFMLVTQLSVAQNKQRLLLVI